MSNRYQAHHRVRVARAALRVAGALPWAAAACASRGPAAPHPAPGMTAEAGIPTGPTSSAAADREAQDSSSVAVGGGRTVERLFAGRFAGVNVQPTSDGGLRIQIRGGNSSFYGGDEPLYLVDGTPLPTGTGGIVHINPYDISKIEVLKNPQDTGVYGLRGANGVIRITTVRPGRR